MSNIQSFVANEPIPYGAVVTLDSSGEANIAEAPNEVPVGVCLADTAEGELCPVAKDGAKVYTLADGNILAGDPLVVDEDGKVRRFVGGDDPGAYWIVGFADYVNSGADGLIRITIDRSLHVIPEPTDDGGGGGGD